VISADGLDLSLSFRSISFLIKSSWSQVVKSKFCCKIITCGRVNFFSGEIYYKSEFFSPQYGALVLVFSWRRCNLEKSSLGGAIAQQRHCPDPKVRLEHPQVSEYRGKSHLLVDAKARRAER